MRMMHRIKTTSNPNTNDRNNSNDQTHSDANDNTNTNTNDTTNDTNTTNKVPVTVARISSNPERCCPAHRHMPDQMSNAQSDEA